MAIPGNIPLLFLFIFLFIEYPLIHNKLLLPAYSSEDGWKKIVVNKDKKNKWKATEKEHTYN